MEHTGDRNKSMEIAIDHLFELPDYYTRLDKMESKTKNELGIKEELQRNLIKKIT